MEHSSFRFETIILSIAHVSPYLSKQNSVDLISDCSHFRLITNHLNRSLNRSPDGNCKTGNWVIHLMRSFYWYPLYSRFDDLKSSKKVEYFLANFYSNFRNVAACQIKYRSGVFAVRTPLIALGFTTNLFAKQGERLNEKMSKTSSKVYTVFWNFIKVTIIKFSTLIIQQP